MAPELSQTGVRFVALPGLHLGCLLPPGESPSLRSELLLGTLFLPVTV